MASSASDSDSDTGRSNLTSSALFSKIFRMARVQPMAEYDRTMYVDFQLLAP